MKIDNKCFRYNSLNGLLNRTNLEKTHLYHYTKAENIEPILCKKPNKLSLFATHINSFDDKAEGQSISKIYKLTLFYLYRKRAISKEIYKVFKNVSFNRTILLFADKDDKFCGTLSKEQETYIISFSQNKNSDYLWDNYADGGVNIAFFHPKIERQDWTNYDFISVVYGKRKQFDLLKKIILWCGNCAEIESNNQRKFILERYLSIVPYIFKKYKYHKEEETRLIYHYDKEAAVLREKQLKGRTGIYIDIKSRNIVMTVNKNFTLYEKDELVKKLKKDGQYENVMILTRKL